MDKNERTEQRDQWYTNKELFEKFTTAIDELSDEMQETKDRLHKYNGLHERFGEVASKLGDMDGRLIKQVKRCDDVQGNIKGKADVFASLYRIWPIILSTIMAVFSIWIATR